MDLFTRADLRSLLAPREPPCVSLFLPTHQGSAEQNSIRFRNLVCQPEERLIEVGFRSPRAKELLTPLHALREDGSFWRNQSDGLAIFLAGEFLRVFRLPAVFVAELHVGGQFSVAPLVPLLQSDGRFYVLALSQNRVRLLQGTRYTIGPIDLKHAPRNLAEALLTHDRDEVLTFHTRPTSGGTWGAIFEGHGVGIDDAKDNLKLYFQKVDHGLHEVLREERAPLLLASVEYAQPIYREANTYPHLLSEGLVGNPDRTSDKQLHERAWSLVAPLFQESLRQALLTYRQLEGTGRTMAQAPEIVAACRRGEVGTLFVAPGQHLWGRLDSATGEVTICAQPKPQDEDLVNLAIVQTLLHGNEVYSVRPQEMPAGTPLAAIGHLPMRHHGKRP